MPRKIRPGRLVADALDSAVGNTALRAHEKRRGFVRQFTHGGQFTCACSPGKEFRGHRAMNAHHMAKHAGRWAGPAARKAGRAMGKELDQARRHAMGWWEAAGLREWKTVPLRDKDGKERLRRDGKPLTREIPVPTAKDRSRPQAGEGRIPISTLRAQHRHDRDHQRAASHDLKGRTDRAADLRDRWPERPERTAHPVPARTR